jgi:hypothetical protein
MFKRRYWEVELKDGTIMQEGQVEWKAVPKKAIIRLSLFYDQRSWHLTGKESYFIKTRASMIPGVKESFRVERRTIGFYEGANKVCYHVEEDTGRFYMEVIDNSGR